MYSDGIMTAPAQAVGCLDAATAVLGDKWTPVLLRFFVNEQSVRFCQLQDLADGINPRTLSARLDHLEQHGIIEKNIMTSAARCEYTLTDKGRDLMPVLVDMEAWSSKYSPVSAA